MATPEKHAGDGGAQVHGHFVDGRHVVEGGAETALVDPSTGQAWATALSSTAGVDAAVASSQRALQDRSWRDLDASDRGRLLLRLADLVEKNAEELARLEVLASGKILRITRREISRAAAWYRFYAGAADKMNGSAVELGKTAEARILHEPMGVVVAITPSNGPISLGTWKIAPALAMGNTVVVKPPIEGPASTLLLGRLAIEAGLPPGVLNVVPGGAEIGRALATHRDVAMVTFTGSTAAAKQLGAEVAQHLKRFVCETGGKSAQIVFDDADLDAALIQARQGVFSNAGQSCVAGSRLLVHRPLLETFIERLAASTRRLRVGNPLDDATHVGPVYSRAQHQRIQDMVAVARGEGAEAATGGKRPDLAAPFDGGFFYEPTVLTGVRRDMPIWREEVFGPVTVVVPFDDEDEAVALANDSRYGLAAALWTRNIARAHRVSRRLEAGTVWINTYRMMHYRVPFGGYKESGLGRENGLEALREFVNTKAIVADHAPPVDAFAY